MTPIEEILIAYASKKHFGMASDVALAEAKQAIKDAVIKAVKDSDGCPSIGEKIVISKINELFK